MRTWLFALVIPACTPIEVSDGGPATDGSMIEGSVAMDGSPADGGVESDGGSSDALDGGGGVSNITCTYQLSLPAVPNCTCTIPFSPKTIVETNVPIVIKSNVFTPAVCGNPIDSHALYLEGKVAFGASAWFTGNAFNPTLGDGGSYCMVSMWSYWPPASEFWANVQVSGAAVNMQYFHAEYFKALSPPCMLRGCVKEEITCMGTATATFQ